MFRRRSHEIDPDIIFINAQNLSELDTSQLEGELERPISRIGVSLFVGALLITGGAFIFQAIRLQVVEGKQYAERSERNRLDSVAVFAERGVIYDRNGTPLVWNELPDTTATSTASTTDAAPTTIPPTGVQFSRRVYADNVGGIGAFIGYLTYPRKDRNGNFTSAQLTPQEGLEKFFDKALSGTPGVALRESDVEGSLLSQSIVEPPVHGTSLHLSIDANLQDALYRHLSEAVAKQGFEGGAAGFMDVTNGELLAYVSAPTFDANIVSQGGEQAEQVIMDKRKLFLDRFALGEFAPGSIVKPFISLAALNENIISPEKSIFSKGYLEIPNPYNPDKPSIFKDWKAHGYVNMRQAIAVSSDVYFYVIGGGFQDQKGLGIKRIDDYMQRFGFGSSISNPLFGGKNGQIPTPEWKEETFDDDWRLGDTYITSIGQFGFLVTPAQMLRSVAAIATQGTLIEPTLLKGDTTYGTTDARTVSFDAADWDVVHDGMELSVKEGTAAPLNGLPFTVAAKTGTAEVGATKDHVHTWTIGYFPADKPRYVFVLMMEKGPKENTLSASRILRGALDEVLAEHPDLFDLDNS